MTRVLTWLRRRVFKAPGEDYEAELDQAALNGLA